MIPGSFKDIILSKIDLATLVAGYIDLQSNGSQLQGPCPFHQGDTPTLSVSADKQIWKCFKCGKGGNAIGFIMEIEKKNYPAAIRFLADKLDLVVPDEEE